MMFANSLAALALAFWGLMSLAGVSAYRSIVGQHVSGYPNGGQATLYLVVPLTVLGCLLVATILLNRFRWGSVPLAICAAASLLPAMHYIMIWSGGI